MAGLQTKQLPQPSPLAVQSRPDFEGHSDPSTQIWRRCFRGPQRVVKLGGYCECHEYRGYMRKSLEFVQRRGGRILEEGEVALSFSEVIKRQLPYITSRLPSAHISDLPSFIRLIEQDQQRLGDGKQTH